MEKTLFWAKKLIPRSVFALFQPTYHYILALLGAIIYRFPARKLQVIAVTGTKGKSSVVEMINAIFEEAGIKTSVLGTIRFKIGNESKPNLYKMTVPGRFFTQHFLRRAVNAGCEFAIIEMTSEGARQFRHKFIDFDALIFTNLQKEHLESHGSYEKYREAKLSIAKSLGKSKKNPRFMIANSDDKESVLFFEAAKEAKSIPFSLKTAGPFQTSDSGCEFQFDGQKMISPLLGKFNIYNLLAAATTAKAFGINTEKIKTAISKLKEIPGRAQIIGGRGFDVVVDYAHTPDSLRAIYEAFKPQKTPAKEESGSDKNLVCVLGNTGGGRDTWKRPEMAKIADMYCDQIILTNEDPYDEDPVKIIEEMSAAIPSQKLTVLIDRRSAIEEAIIQDRKKLNSVVLLTGKGTDPFIMTAKGGRIEWSDAQEVRDVIKKFHLNK